MKSFRINFEKGINTVGDKALLGDGYATILDNVDLRSGSPRPFRAPEFQFAVASTTTRSWSYRGRWFHSTNWRDYVGEYIGGIERVFYTEEGKYPQKAIEGTSVRLGTPRPNTVLGITKTSLLCPANLTVTTHADGSGNLPDGERLYRVSAKTTDGILPPCPPITVTIADTAHVGTSVTLTWTAVPNATAYVIFEGTTAGQYRLDEVSPANLTYTDTGAKSASGDLATAYSQEEEFEYAYTYKRNVNGVFDESGLSAPSIPMASISGRTITRDFINDGYFSNALDSSGTSLAITGTGTLAASASAVSLSGVAVSYNYALLQTVFNKTGHGLSTGMQLQFTLSDPVWSGQTFEIVKIDADNFAVKNKPLPSDGTPLPSTAAYRLLASTVTYTASTEVVDNDVVYIVGAGATTTISGLYKATRLSSSTFSIPFVSTESMTLTTVKFIPKNNYYWKWCLYRNEQGVWNLVEELDLDKTTFTDAKPFASLGGLPSSYYTENGQTVDFDAAPIGLQSIESHYGMKFGIDGHNIRWTPILQPDAWPETFFVTMDHKPVRVVSFSQGLIILCQDAIWRLDGNEPTGLSLAKTHAEDGCFAPNTVQKTEKGLIYLSKRGIMLFNGTHAECLTDTRVPGRVINGPSKLATTYPFYWLPTIMTRNYSDLAGEDGTLGSSYSFTLDNTTVIDGYVKDIKSFYHLGKYYLFYTGSNYEANTAFVMDLQLPGFPITTLGMKALDAHVDEYEQCFVLFNNAPPVTTVTITSPL